MSDKLQRIPPGGLSRLDRLKLAVRAYWMGPIYSSDHGARDFFGGSPTSTGLDVNEFTALNYSAVFAAVGLISSQVGNLPLLLYRKAGDGKERFDRHPLYRLVHDRPNPDMSAFVFRETLQAHVLTWGNGYAEIVRDGAGRPSALWPITPDRVTPFRRGSDAALEYRVVNQDGSDAFIAAGDMLHVPGHGFNGITGYSVIAKMRESVGLGLAAERFGGTFFGNGAQFGGVISVPTARPSEQVVENDRKAINSKHQGVDKAHRFLMLYNGATYAQLGIPPNDAQFLETRIFQVAEIARWFNLPPHKLKELTRSTNNNIEHQNLEYYIDCLAPWLEKWEQELCEKLISPLERTQQSIEFVADGLLRGDAASRGEFNSKQFAVGMLTANEGRKLENRNPIDGGNDPFVPLNLIPLPLARPYFEAQIEAIKAKATADLRPPPPPGPTAEQQQQQKQRDDQVMSELAAARRIAQANEDAKDLAVHAHDQAVADLGKVQTAHDALLAARATDRVDFAAQIETLRSDLITAQGLRDQTLAAKDTAEATRATLAGDVARVQLMLETAVRDVTARTAEREALTQQVAGLSTQIESLSLDVTVAQRDLDAAMDRAAQMTTQATSLGTDLIAAQRDLAAAVARAEMIEGDYRRVCDEKTAVETQIAEREAAIATLCAELQGLTEQLTTATTTVAELRQMLATADVTGADTVRKLNETVALVTQHEIAASRMRDRLVATTQALRGVLVEVSSRILAHQADRARKAHRGSPEKLAQWIDAFFDAQSETCRELLRPAIRAWLVAVEAETQLERTLDRVVPFFVDECARQLRGVLADLPTDDALPLRLERVVTRWETERAEILADRIMKEVA